MSDLICKKTMVRCQTPGMCSPHGGCQPEKTEWQAGYDEGRRMGTKTALAERDRLNADNEALRKDDLRSGLMALAAYIGPICTAAVISAMAKGEQQ